MRQKRVVRRLRLCPLLLLMSPLAPSIHAQAQTQVKAQPAAQAPLSSAQAAQLVIGRYRQVRLQGRLADEATLRGWMKTLDAGGQWPDIDYADTSPADWKTKDHLARVGALARAVADPNLPLAQDPALWQTTTRALDWWLAKRPKNSNWWHNDIGVPGMMSDVIIVLGERLTGERLTGALEVLNQFGRAKPGNGTNTIWEAELAIKYGALAGDFALVERYSRMIADEIKVTTGEGVQSDGSFHQHRQRLQQFHYGGAFLADSARLGWQLSSTPWAIPAAKLQILADLVLNGNQWMVRGTTTVPGTLDRSISRPGSQKGADMRASLRYLRDALPERATELDVVLARQEGTGAPLVGFRAFPRSDFATYHRPNFSFFLKTISDRTFPTESINFENQKGALLNNGDGYLLRDGQEYVDLPPVWNWDALPGTTWARGAGLVQRRPFVGSIGDGTSGATAMDVAYGPKDAPTFTARKFWACHGDLVVALIGDLRAPNAIEPLRTALDQSLLRGPVQVGNPNGQISTLAAGTNGLQAHWVYHHGIAYLPLGGLPLTIKTGPATGKWSDINKSQSSAPVTQPVFLPMIEHGAKPDGQNSGYVLAAANSAQGAAAIAQTPTWQVLRNDATCQAVRFDDGTLMAAFWTAGTLGAGGQFLSVDKPCLVLESHNQVRVSDPTQIGGPLTLVLGSGATHRLTLPAGGESAAPIARLGGKPNI